MKLTYTVLEDDYLNFTMDHVRHSATVRRSLIVQRVMTPIMFLGIAYMMAAFFGASYAGSFLAFGAMSVLWVVVYPKFFYSSIRRQSRKAIREGSNAGILGRHTMTFSEEGLVHKTPTDKTEVQWSGIVAFKESEEALYLYNSAVSAYIIPKRDLENEAHVRAYVQERVKTKVVV